MARGRQDEAYSEAQLRSVLRAGVVTLVVGGATGVAALWASFLFIRGWLRLR